MSVADSNSLKRPFTSACCFFNNCVASMVSPLVGGSARRICAQPILLARQPVVAWLVPEQPRRRLVLSTSPPSGSGLRGKGYVDGQRQWAATTRSSSFRPNGFWRTSTTPGSIAFPGSVLALMNTTGEWRAPSQSAPPQESDDQDDQRHDEQEVNQAAT